MEKTKFVWLMDSQSARNGHRLIKGQTYKVADFKADTVEIWVKAKAAKYSTAKSAEEDKS